MRELLRDPDAMTKVLRRRVLRALIPAVGKLTRVARGRDAFANEHQLRACVTLARLAPILIADQDANAAGAAAAPSWFDQPLTLEEQLGWDRFEWLQTLTPEQDAARAARRDVLYEEWRGSRPRRFNSAAEASEYFQTHPIVPFSDIEEELWPDHLKRSNYLKEADHE